MKDGRSLLWEACGKKFTGLDYPEADKLSRKNKEFIKELFPSSDIYASLFSSKAQKLIGEVGKETRGVKRMLERIGFRYVGHIDPFDGGPHFEANLADVALVRKFRVARVGATNFDGDGDDVLLARTRPTAKNHFLAVRANVRLQNDIVLLPAQESTALGVKKNDKVAIIPFE